MGWSVRLSRHFRSIHFVTSKEILMKQQTTIQAAIAGLLALGLAASVSAAPVPPDASKDKCFGIAKAGQNDRAAGGTLAPTEHRRQRPGVMEIRGQGYLREDRR
jgi:hypothetical protein